MSNFGRIASHPLIKLKGGKPLTWPKLTGCKTCLSDKGVTSPLMLIS